MIRKFIFISRKENICIENVIYFIIDDPHAKIALTYLHAVSLKALSDDKGIDINVENVEN